MTKQDSQQLQLRGENRGVRVYGDGVYVSYRNIWQNSTAAFSVKHHDWFEVDDHSQQNTSCSTGSH
jgi:hypothetical protein